MGGGTPFGVLAELLAASMNPNMGGGEHSAIYVEMQVLDWCKEMLGYPPEASGLYRAKVMAVPTPNSVKDRIARMFVNRLWRPRYSAPSM